jgi:hypothetical protein
MKTKIFFLILISIICTSVSYSQVIVTLQQPPPFQFKADNLWKVTLTNKGASVNVYLFGEVVNVSTGQKVVEGRTANFTLPPGIKKVNANEISPVDITKYDNTIENTLNKTGTFKSGEYSICVYVRDANTNIDLGSYCNDYEILNVTQSELIAPEDLETVSILQPLFSWMPPTPFPTGVQVTYEISIYPVLNRQTPYYATISNPAIFNEKSIRNTIFQYPLAGKPLMQGMKYAWQVSTYFNGALMNQSEVRTFEYSNGIAEELMENNSSKLPKGRGENFYFNKNKEDKNITDWLEEKKHSIRIKSASYYESMLFDAEPFEFKASYKLSGNLQNKQSTNSQEPKNFGSFTFNPTVVLYGIPFTADLYLDTKQKDFKQNINSFAFLFDIKSLKDMVTQKLEEKKNQLIEEYKNMGQQELNNAMRRAENEIPGYMKVLSMFSDIGIWETYPQYSEYTVSGVKVKGLDFTFNPGLFYLKATGLSNLDKIPDSVFARNLYAGSMGIGSKENSHFHLTFMKSYDREASLDLSKVPLNVTPGENTVVGTDGKLKLFGDRIAIETEANVSVTTRDKLAPKLAAGEIPSIVEDLTNANTSSQYDFMYRIKSDFNIPESKSIVGFEYKLIGPGFISYGAPGLSGKGKLGYKISLAQEFLEGKIMFNGGFEYKDDNVGGLNSTTSTTNKMDFKLRLKFEDAPTLTLRYIPIVTENDAPNPIYYKTNLDIFSLISGFKATSDALISNTMLMVTSTNSKDNKPMDSTHYSLVDFTIREDIFFKKLPGLSLSASASYNAKNAANDKTNVTSFDFTTAYTFFNLWTNSLGLNFTKETGRNKKLTLSFTSGIPVWMLGDFFLTAEQSFYREELFMYGNKDEFILTAGLSKSF